MADRDDRYRGYGNPSGRYYENREYDRGGGFDRDRGERGGWFGGNDRDRNETRGSYRDRDNDRGFLERAGEEIRSWFGDDDDRGGRERGRDDYRGQSRFGDRHDYPQTTRAESTGGLYRDQRHSAGYETGGSRAFGGSSGYGGERNRGGVYGGADRDRFGGSHPHDEHYSEWREQQLNAFDRDYEEYRRENRDRFHNEFSSWRGQRETQRSSLKQVREHQEVFGTDGEKVGTVDKVAGDKIILTKNDPQAGGHHHSIPSSWVQSVDDKVTINKTAAQAREKWTDEENRRALFESEDQRRDDGPHVLNRSFSGTYDR